jgi:hypothetical protein
MGAPTLSILSEFYLPYMENKKFFDILCSTKINGYYRYVDEILIVYNLKHTDVEVHKLFNKVTTDLKFTLEKEKDKNLNFLDLTYLEQRTDYLSIYLASKIPLITLSHGNLDTHWSIKWQP